MERRGLGWFESIWRVRFPGPKGANNNIGARTAQGDRGVRLGDL